MKKDDNNPQVIQRKIRNFEKDHNNIKLVSVLREKDFVEARLANIYNMLRDLKVKTNSIKEEIKNLEIALENYETISNRINELENELNNK